MSPDPTSPPAQHPLSTPRSAVAIALVALLAGLVAPFMPPGYVIFVILIGYVSGFAILWLCREELNALFSQFKSRVIHLSIFPGDFWLILGLAVFAFVMSSFVVFIQLNRDIALSGPIMESQIRELEEIQTFIGGKDDHSIEELFDIHHMLKCNLEKLVYENEKTKLSEEQVRDIETCSKDARAYGQFGDLKVSGYGIPMFRASAGKMGMVYTTKKYEDGCNILERYIKSPQIPSPMVTKLKSLYNALLEIPDTFIESVNQKLSQNPNAAWDDLNRSSPLYGNITEPYYENLKLKPLTDAVTLEIRKYYRIE